MELQDVMALISALIAGGSLVFSIINSTFRLRSAIGELITIRDGINDNQMRACLDAEIARLTGRLVKRIKENTRLKAVLIWTFAAGLSTSLATYLQEMISGDYSTSLSGLQIALWFGGILVAIIAAISYVFVLLIEWWAGARRGTAQRAGSENVLRSAHDVSPD